MAIIRKFNIIFIVAQICVLVASCDMRSDNNTRDGNNDSYQSGRIYDGAVSGLQYKTETISGETDENGWFKYKSNENISFFVGDILIGETAAKSVVTPLDFDPEFDWLGEDMTPSDKITNILRFLQTIDDDGEVDNGIQITDVVNTNAAGLSMDFDQTTAEFEVDTEAQKIMSDLASLNQSGFKGVVNVQAAQAHFSKTVVDLYGEEVDWEAYISPQHGKQWSYSREQQYQGGVVSDEVTTYLQEAHIGETPIWVQGWSENWKLNQFDYIAKDFSNGVNLIGVQDANLQETFFEKPKSIYFAKAVFHKWLPTEIFENGMTRYAKIKVEPGQKVDTLDSTYTNVLQISTEDVEHNVRITNWYAIGAGLVKKVIEDGDVVTSYNLLQYETLTEFPHNPVTDRIISTQLIKQFITEKENIYIERFQDQVLLLALSMSIQGQYGSPEHIDAFHAIYIVQISAMEYEITKKIIDISLEYKIDKNAVFTLIQDSFLNSYFEIALYAGLTGIYSTELLETTYINLVAIYQTAIDVLNISYTIVDQWRELVDLGAP